MIVIDFCFKEGDSEYLQIHYDNATNLYWAVVKGKADNLIWFTTPLTSDYEESKRLAEDISLH